MTPPNTAPRESACVPRQHARREWGEVPWAGLGCWSPAHTGLALALVWAPSKMIPEQSVWHEPTAPPTQTATCGTSAVFFVTHLPSRRFLVLGFVRADISLFSICGARGSTRSLLFFRAAAARVSSSAGIPLSLSPLTQTAPPLTVNSCDTTLPQGEKQCQKCARAPPQVKRRESRKLWGRGGRGVVRRHCSASAAVWGEDDHHPWGSSHDP